MKRGRVIDISNCCVHVTQRCHNRQFMLKFGLDRRNYVRRLRKTSRRFAVSVLDYVVTSNHVHLLLRADRISQISDAMQYLQGLTARDFNRRKGRSGAFWGDRFHPTLVESGAHLSRCVYYIGLNMVRAGAVEHPQQWSASGYHELSGRRQRYRILDLSTLLHRLELCGRVDRFRQWYVKTMDEMSSSGYLCREPCWTEATAVGSRDWVESLADSVISGRKQVVPIDSPEGVVREEDQPSYALNLSARQSHMLWEA